MKSSSARVESIRATDCAPVKAVVRPSDVQDKELVLMRDDLRKAIELAEWKHDALARVMSEASGLSIDGPYLSKILSGEKMLTAAHLAALPNEIEAIYNRLRSERFGQIVVAPVEGADAVRNLVSGLVGVLCGKRTA